MKKFKRTFLMLWPYVVLLGCLFVSFLPILWVILSSFKPAGDILTVPPFYFPKTWTLQHYYDIFFKQDIPIVFKNSLVISTISTIICVSFGTMAAYVFARSKSKFLDGLLSGILAGRMMPAVALLIPLYMAMRYLNLVNTKTSLIIAYTAIGLPFAIYMMIGFIQQVPYEIEEAGIVDGCSRFKVLTKLIVPLIGPGLASTAIFTFLTAWNEYLFAVIFMIDNKAKTIPVALMAFDTGRNTYWGPRFATMVISLIPATLFTLMAQKYLVSGVTLGAVKG